MTMWKRGKTMNLVTCGGSPENYHPNLQLHMVSLTERLQSVLFFFFFLLFSLQLYWVGSLSHFRLQEAPVFSSRRPSACCCSLGLRWVGEHRAEFSSWRHRYFPQELVQANNRPQKRVNIGLAVIRWTQIRLKMNDRVTPWLLNVSQPWMFPDLAS